MRSVLKATCWGRQEQELTGCCGGPARAPQHTPRGANHRVSHQAPYVDFGNKRWSWPLSPAWGQAVAGPAAIAMAPAEPNPCARLHALAGNHITSS